MKAIIFAAGMGTRISRHIGDAPKCLINVHGMPLINYTIALLQAKGFDDIGVVTGYKAELIEDVLPDDVTVFRNPFYQVTNSIASFWMAREFFSSSADVLSMNGDVFLEETVIDEVLRTKSDDKLALMVADSGRIAGADYKFFWTEGCLEKYGKHLTPQDTTGEYVGLGVIPRQRIDQIVGLVNREIMTGNYGKWWEEAIYEQSAGGEVGILDIRGHFWVELDFVEDLNRLRHHLGSQARVAAE